MLKKLKQNKRNFLLTVLAIIIPATTIAITYGVLRNQNAQVQNGVSGDTVYINDLDADYYYYTGQNYTSSSNSLPTSENKNIYNDNNLVKVTVTYNGTDYSSKNTGYVSLTEKQSKYIYYKYYPIINGYIEIDLIDNPFSYHPNDLVFNGWITNYNGANISYNDTYYTRTAKIPVNSTKDINIDFYANWTTGQAEYVNNSFDTAISNLKAKGMNKVETVKYIYDYPSVDGYYKGDSITTKTVVTGWWGRGDTTYGTCTDCYDSSGSYHSSYRCPAPDIGWGQSQGTYTNNCQIYYKQTSNDTFDMGSKYYTYNNYNGFEEANLKPTLIGKEENENFTSTTNMAGYYRKVNINYRSSITGYYNETGVMQNGTCSTNSGCKLYELIQFYKADGTKELYNENEEYYYLTTRDTNILIMNTSASSTWGSSSTKPFTLTGIYNGKDYNPTWTVSNIAVKAYDALRIENMTINSRKSSSTNVPTSSANGSGTFYGNYQNVKIGRGIKQTSNYKTFDSVIAGANSSSSWDSSDVGSSDNPKKFTMTVESGFYNSASSSTGAKNQGWSSSLYTQMNAVYGNDYDRAAKNNSNLDFYFCVSGSWYANVHSSDDNNIAALNTIVKSGTFGSSKSDLTTGIYVGGRYSGTHYAKKTAKVEGGYIYNLIGGPLTDSTRGTKNDVLIYMTGGEIDMITGGAGTSTTYGNRIIQVTGGTVNYSVFGGSNGRDGTSSDGTLTGSSYVYIGGTATIGNDKYIENKSTLFGAESGSVFGAGNGNTSYATIGSVDNSVIVINDEATIKKNVYGSGNYGTVGYSSSSDGSVNINIFGGTIGSVFGSGNNSGSGKEWQVSIPTNIKMTGGNVTGGIYGGSNQKGTLYGDVTLNILNGNVNNVFGGGLGKDTVVSQNVTVNLGDNTNSLNLTGSAYGGSAYGTVNDKTKTTSVSTYKTLVNVNGGNIANVFGGGKGDENNTPYVAGDVTLTINNGKINNAFGGNNAAGTPNGEVKVYLNGGEVTSAYGGGNKTAVTKTHVYQNSSICQNIFGGSNESGEVETSTINVAGGQTTNLYGGNNIGGTVKNTNITVNGGEITSAYGGGKKADTTASDINVLNGKITNIYGGGEEANISSKTTINITDGTITSIYGGSNKLGSVPVSNITVNGGIIDSVYGGNNQGGVTTTTNINLNSGNINTAYGGGNKATSTTSNIKLNGSTVQTIYGGGNEAGVTTTNVNLITGSSTEVFGGSNKSGTVTTSNVKASTPQNLIIDTIYGGNNNGGKVKQTDINLSGGTYNNIYGGGNNADVDYTNVHTDKITMTGKFYGGGNNASVIYNTNVEFLNSSIDYDIFGGGNLGTVEGNTVVYLSNAVIKGSAYAGGNGKTATVLGNTTLTIDNTSTVSKHVFGGGNAANTGSKDNTSSISKVNIAGATINGNVYGGANTAILYGKTILNIGANVNDYVKTDIQIGGTVFGGGEANANGDANYDYSFISVTEGITINIDGENYKNFDIKGSIFGSGNASSTKGYSYINISNYGTFENYKENISLQRTDIVTIKNSAIKLEGTTDRTNEYSSTKFSISRVGELKLANNSTLFLQNGTNLLEKFTSVKINGATEEKATVKINGDSVTKNVNNRVYMLENKNLNIATNEAVTSYGKVSGMTFFGMYQLDRNGKVYTAFYDNKYNSGDTVSSGEFYTFTAGSYVLGMHNKNHDIQTDGFYSNYENKDKQGTVESRYIEPTPSDASYYMWVIGEKVTTYDFSLTASKYSTLGTYELPLNASASANMTYEIIGFNYQNLEEGFELVSPSSVPRINTSGSADNKMALSMETSNTGFISKGQTNFLTNSNTPIEGTKDYISENSSIVPSFLFYLYHSKNITEKKEIGTAVISLLAIKPIDDLNNEVTRININITLSSALYSDNDYEGAMTAGEKYDLFASTATNITNKSNFSAYYSLYMKSSKKYYQDGYYHALVSDYVLPVNTKITMIDLASKKYYYYVITEEDVTKAKKEYEKYGECSYALSEFIAMGSTSPNNTFDESQNNNKYYKTGYVDEEFIFNVSFEDTNITGDVNNKKLLLELRNKSDQTLNSVLSIQHSSLTYNLYDDSKATINLTGDFTEKNVYLGDIPALTLTANFTQPIINSLPVTDTTYFDKKMGVKISIYDEKGNKLNNSSLLGLTYEYNNKTYYPRMDGSVRIPVAEKVANWYGKIKVNTKNLNLSSGSYKFIIEAFGSSDGIYFGATPSSKLAIDFKIVDSVYGLNVKLPDDEIIINGKEGLNSKKTNALDFDTGYSSNLANPNIRVSIYRRLYNEIYDTEYEKISLDDYITNRLNKIGDDYDYMFIESPNSNSKKTLYLKNSLRNGTYKFVFSLYDGDNFIGDGKTYIIIK